MTANAGANSGAGATSRLYRTLPFPGIPTSLACPAPTDGTDMTWLKIDDNLPTHPKIAQVGAEAAWLWICGLCYSRRHLTDGRITHAVLPGLSPSLKHVGKLATKLVLAGLWEATDDGYQIHDFLEWNPSRIQVESYRKADRERKKIPDGIQTTSSRASAGVRTSTSNSSSFSASERSSEESARETNGFEQFWAIYPRKVGKDGARKAFEKRHFDADSLKSVLNAVSEQARSHQWQREGGQFIPHPATWLNQGRWQDEPEITVAERPLNQFELRQATEIRRSAFARCPHEPECATFEDCVKQIALERRQKVGA